MTQESETIQQVSKSATALYHALQNHDSSQVLLEKKSHAVVEINHETDPVNGAKKLLKHQVLGALVWDDSVKRYCGYFDMRDLLNAVLYATKKKQHEEDVNPFMELMSESVGASLDYLSYPLYTLPPDTSLVKVGEFLSEPKCRRVAICNDGCTQCENIVTRRSLLKFMSKHISYADLQEKLDDAGLDYRKGVIQVTDDTKAFDTFKLMDSKGLYGIAVVDEEDGSLVGYTSASDIRLAADDEGKSSMDMNIMSYLAAVRQWTISGRGKAQYPICYVHEDATVAQVVQKLVKTGYHRLFVVDEAKVPVGVISLFDILNFAMTKSDKR